MNAYRKLPAVIVCRGGVSGWMPPPAEHVDQIYQAQGERVVDTAFRHGWRKMNTKWFCPACYAVRAKQALGVE